MGHGVILYELAARKKAFKSDIDVYFHGRLGTTFNVVLDERFDEDAKDDIYPENKNYKGC